MYINIKNLIISVIISILILTICSAVFYYLLIKKQPDKVEKIPSNNEITLKLNESFDAFNNTFLKSNTVRKQVVERLQNSENISSTFISESFLNTLYPNKYSKDVSFLKFIERKLNMANFCETRNCFISEQDGLPYMFGFFVKLRYQKQIHFVKLADGTTYAIDFLSSDCKYMLGGYENVCGQGYVDINGKKPPNILDFDIYKYNIIYKDNGILEIVPAVNYYSKEVHDMCFIKHESCTAFAQKGDFSYLKTKLMQELLNQYKNGEKVPQYYKDPNKNEHSIITRTKKLFH